MNLPYEAESTVTKLRYKNIDELILLYSVDLSTSYIYLIDTPADSKL